MDWSMLVPEVLHIISKKLEKMSDFVRFRAVCKAWRTSVSLCEHPPQFPLLLRLPFYANERTLELRSIISGETLTMPVPGGDELIVGSINGYVMFQGIYNKFLFNPLSKRKIPVPLNLRSYRVQHFSESNKKRRLLCSGCNRSSQIKFKKLQAEFFEPNIHNWYMKKEINTNGMDLIPQTNIKCSLIKRDAFNGNMLSETPMPSEPSSYDDDDLSHEIILESFGDVLRVIFKHDLLNAITGIDVHKLDQGNRFPHFVKTRSIGDRVLFFATSNLKCWSARSDDIPKHKGNCIYFWNFKCDCEGDGLPKCSYELSRYDLEEDIIEILPLRTEENYIWLMPNLC